VTPRTDDPRFGWVVVGALSASVTVGFGVLTYAFAVLLVPMESDTGWSRTALTAAVTLAGLVQAAAALVVGPLLDRHSPRLLMTCGAVAAASLVVAWSQVTALWQLYLVFAGLGVAMSTLLYTAVFTVVTKWFDRSRTTAIATVTMFGATASLIFSPLTERLEAVYGWRTALLVLAAILAVVAVPLHGLVLRPGPQPTDAARRPEHAPRRVVRSRPFVFLTTAFAINDFVWAAVIVHLVALLIAAGHDSAFAALIAGLTGIAQLPGRAAFVVLGRYVTPKRQPLVVFVPLLAALVVLASDRGAFAAVVFALLYGCAGGIGTVYGATVVGDLWGRATYGAISAVKASAQSVARALGPVAASLLLALLPGGYATLLLVFAVLIAAAAAAASRGVQLALR
jgi:MFS family permease